MSLSALAFLCLSLFLTAPITDRCTLMICLNITLCNRGSANSFISFSIPIQCDRFMSALLQNRGRQPLALKEPFGPVATITKPTRSLKVMDQCAQTMLHLNCIWLKTSERRDSSVSGGPQQSPMDPVGYISH